MDASPLRIGVALCGAELGGTVHVGVLYALEHLGLKIHHVAGTSAGSLVASMYAHGYTLNEFENFVDSFPGLLLMDYAFPFVSSAFNLVRHRWKGRDVSVPSGMFRGRKLERYIRRIHKNRLPKMAYSVVATDLYTTDAVAFSNDSRCIERGFAQRSIDIAREIAGSCAIPGIVTPVRYRQRLLVDGGVRDVVPVSILRKAGCNKIIAVDVLKLSKDWYPVTIVDVLKRSLATMMDESTDEHIFAGRDVLVIQPKVEWAKWWSCRDPMKRNVEFGYQYVMDMRDQILRFLAV